jgi:hypothetical protein
VTDHTDTNADADLKRRSERRRALIEAHRAPSQADAEAWDLDYWQRQGPEGRLSALVAIHRDVAAVDVARDAKAR